MGAEVVGGAGGGAALRAALVEEPAGGGEEDEVAGGRVVEAQRPRLLARHDARHRPLARHLEVREEPPQPLGERGALLGRRRQVDVRHGARGHRPRRGARRHDVAVRVHRLQPLAPQQEVGVERRVQRVHAVVADHDDRGVGHRLADREEVGEEPVGHAPDGAAGLVELRHPLAAVARLPRRGEVELVPRLVDVRQVDHRQVPVVGAEEQRLEDVVEGSEVRGLLEPGGQVDARAPGPEGVEVVVVRRSGPVEAGALELEEVAAREGAGAVDAAEVDAHAREVGGEVEELRVRTPPPLRPRRASCGSKTTCSQPPPGSSRSGWAPATSGQTSIAS